MKAAPERIPKFPISKFRFHFDGRHSLKGVLDGTPYPLLWLDVEPDRLIHATEDILSARSGQRSRRLRPASLTVLHENR